MISCLKQSTLCNLSSKSTICLILGKLPSRPLDIEIGMCRVLKISCVILFLSCNCFGNEVFFNECSQCLRTYEDSFLGKATTLRSSKTVETTELNADGKVIRIHSAQRVQENVLAVSQVFFSLELKQIFYLNSVEPKRTIEGVLERPYSFRYLKEQEGIESHLSEEFGYSISKRFSEIIEDYPKHVLKTEPGRRGVGCQTPQGLIEFCLTTRCD